MSTDHLPEGYQTITPYLVVADPAALIAFLSEAWSATICERMEREDGSVRHAEMQLGTSRLMMGRAQGEQHRVTPSMLYLYVDDADAWYARALGAGARPKQEPADAPYGDRTAAVEGPCGNTWYLATRQKQVQSEVAEARLNARDAT